MKLYYAPGTCALACWIALEWANADYEVEKVDYASAEYKKVNPLGMVPALDIGGSRAMTQANAILQYIADSHPAARLGAEDGPEAQFEFNETMAFLTGDFHPAYWPMFSPARYTTDKTPAAHNAVAKPPTRASTASWRFSTTSSASAATYTAANAASPMPTPTSWRAGRSKPRNPTAPTRTSPPS